jgi:hypothetical protein
VISKPKEKENAEREENNEVEAAPIFSDSTPIFAEENADVREPEGPDRRSDKRVEGESPERDAGRAGGK